APNKNRIISRMTIKSGPAKFMKLARRLIQSFQDQAVSTSCKAIPRGGNEGYVIDRISLLWEKRPYATYLERQHQLWAGLYSGGRLSRHTRGKAYLSAAS